MGIQPGITTATQAKMLIEKAYNSLPGVEVKFSDGTGSLLKFGFDDNSAVSTRIDLTSISAQDDAIVTEIEFNFRTGQKREFSLGDLELIFPPPTCIRWMETEPPGPPFLIALEYVRKGVLTGEAVIRTNDPLNPTDAVLKLRYFESDRPFSPDPYCRLWQGFTTLENYYPMK